MNEAEVLLHSPVKRLLTRDEAVQIADYFGLDREAWLTYLRLSLER